MKISKIMKSAKALLAGLILTATMLFNLGFAQVAYADEFACEDQFFGGVLPGGTPVNDVIVARADYCIAVNPNTKFADWIGYHLTPAEVSGDAIDDYTLRNDPDLEDASVLEKADYKGTFNALRMDRGHLAPLTVFRAVEDTDSISYLGNIVPQAVTINRGVWRVLEARERSLALQNPDLYVVTGTAYLKTMSQLPNADEDHTVPSAFWKYIRYGDNELAYIFDQETERGASVNDGAVTVAELESIVGYQLNPVVETPAEETPAEETPAEETPV